MPGWNIKRETIHYEYHTYWGSAGQKEFEQSVYSLILAMMCLGSQRGKAGFWSFHCLRGFLYLETLTSTYQERGHTWRKEWRPPWSRVPQPGSSVCAFPTFVNEKKSLELPDCNYCGMLMLRWRSRDRWSLTVCPCDTCSWLGAAAVLGRDKHL